MKALNMKPMAQTGNWAWSSWQNHMVTAKGKTTASAIAAAILSYIPAVGPLAGAFATIFIQNEMQTGYFSTSQGSRMDTNPAYIWRSSKVKLYKDADRTNLLSSKQTTPSKELINH